MGVTAESGPLVTFVTPPLDYNAEVGPNVWHKGDLLGDPRAPFAYAPGQPDTTLIYGWPTIANIPIIDQVPVTASASNIASATPASGTALVLASSSVSGVTVGCTVRNANTGQNVSGLLGLDVNTNRTATVTFTNGSPKVGWSANTLLGVKLGDSLTLTTSSALPTPYALATTYYVVAVGNAELMLSATPGGTPISATSGGTGTQTAHYVAPAQQSPLQTGPQPSFPGPVTMWNPAWALSRAVGVTSNGDDTGGSYTIVGYDIYGYPMTQTITGLSSGQAVTTKAFKYVASVTPNGTINSTTLTVGTLDVFGLPLRADYYQYLSVMWGTPAVLLAYSAGTFVAADVQTATATSGDVRGTIYGGSASDGTKRLFVFWNAQPGNLLTTQGLLGQNQF